MQPIAQRLQIALLAGQSLGEPVGPATFGSVRAGRITDTLRLAVPDRDEAFVMPPAICHAETLPLVFGA